MKLRGLYTIPAGAPFLTALAAGLWEAAEKDPMRLAEMRVLLPTRRACRTLHRAFASLLDGAALLPAMQPLGDIDEDVTDFATGFTEGAEDLPPALSHLKRQMLLTRLVRQSKPDMSLDQAALLSESLAQLMDEAAINGRNLTRLGGLVQEKELAKHWEEIVSFLSIITDAWPKLLVEYDAMDAVPRRLKLMERQIAAWEETPPTTPVIIAGSTGSTPVTASLIAAVAALPAGTVVLPGLDRAMPRSAWNALEENHPQFGMRNLLETLKMERSAAQLWPTLSSDIENTPRAKLLSAAMLPPSASDTWRDLKPDDFPPAALTGIARLELDHSEEEAAVIALRLRAVLETADKTAALVTPDRGLAERVAAALTRWDIAADDSAGRSLARSRGGSFMAHVITASAPHAGEVVTLALLKHPLAAMGFDAAECRRRARVVEMTLWRQRMDAERTDKNADIIETAENYRDTFTSCLKPLRDVWTKKQNLAEWISLHRQIAEDCAATENETGTSRLWRGAAQEKLSQWLDEWHGSGEALAPMNGEDYAALFTHMLRRATYRPAFGQHPRLAILGPLEARLIEADLIILGGLNEGVWPAASTADPWMSRPMKRAFGLPLPEQRTGLAAHDFAQLSSAPEVLMTRARRQGNAPSVPSRFLLQIETVLTALSLIDKNHTTDILAPQEPWAAWALMLDEPTGVPTPIAPPAPTPPLAARPRKLSVTRVATWQRNPYEIYARYVLGLRKLDPLEKDVDAADRGLLLHAALEDFTQAYPAALPPNAYEKLLEFGAKRFAPLRSEAQVEALWWPRFQRLAWHFVKAEKARRERGIVILASEAEGSRMFGDFTLQGRADRIDRLAHGTFAIIDYKSTKPPSATKVEQGEEPQLPLLGLIAATGGFATKEKTQLPPGTVDNIAYWYLGNDAAATGKGLDKDLNVGSAALMREAEEGFMTLIAAYDDATMPYLVTPDPANASRYDDYAHLARRAEWGYLAGGGDD